LLAGSFVNYAMPRADTLPLLATALSEIPAPLNRLDYLLAARAVRQLW
jgi:hypothetical protein